MVILSRRVLFVIFKEYLRRCIAFSHSFANMSSWEAVLSSCLDTKHNLFITMKKIGDSDFFCAQIGHRSKDSIHLTEQEIKWILNLTWTKNMTLELATRTTELLLEPDNMVKIKQNVQGKTHSISFTKKNIDTVRLHLKIIRRLAITRRQSNLRADLLSSVALFETPTYAVVSDPDFNIRLMQLVTVIFPYFGLSPDFDPCEDWAQAAILSKTHGNRFILELVDFLYNNHAKINCN